MNIILTDICRPIYFLAHISQLLQINAWFRSTPSQVLGCNAALNIHANAWRLYIQSVTFIIFTLKSMTINYVDLLHYPRIESNHFPAFSWSFFSVNTKFFLVNKLFIFSHHLRHIFPTQFNYIEHFTVKKLRYSMDSNSR